MGNTPSPDTAARRTVAADDAVVACTLQSTAAKVTQPLIRSISSISEELAHNRVDGNLMAFGKGTTGSTSTMYLGSNYYELTSSEAMTSLPRGLTILRLTDKLREAHDDFAGACISDSGILSHRDGSILGKASISAQGSIILQIPRWQQED